jgi:hypothetical protein
MVEKYKVDSLTLLAIHCVSYVSYFLGICSCFVKKETHSYITDKCTKIHQEIAIMKMLIIYTANLFHYGDKQTIQQNASLL